MDVQGILIEIDWAMANVDFDLDRWEQELEQAKYAAQLDALSDFEFMELDQTLGGNWAYWKLMPVVEELVPDEELKPKILPLAWYGRGERYEIGSAVYDPLTGQITARLRSDYWKSIFGQVDAGRYSIRENLSLEEYYVDPEPITKSSAMESFMKGLTQKTCISCDGTNGDHYVGCTLYR